MDLQFLNNNKGKYGIVFNENGSTSDILYLQKVEVEQLIKQTRLAILNENDNSVLFDGNNKNKSKFSYIKQKNSLFLLSISVTDNFAIGKVLKHADLKRIISQLSRMI